MTIRRIAVVLALAFAAPLSAGTVLVKLANYINFAGTTDTQTFNLSTQVFTGSTDCSSGGGSVTTTPHIDSVTGISLDVGAGNSVLLTADPGTPQAMSEQRGLFVSWGADVSLSGTITFLPGDGRQICVAGYSGAGVREYDARFYAGIQILDECGNEKYNWRPGDTIVIKVSGGLTFEPEQQRLLAAGGSVNECTFIPEGPAFTTVHIDSDPFTYTFVLPDSDSDIPAGCSGVGGTQHITGDWRVVAFDSSCGCNRAQTRFTVANDAPAPTPCTITCPDDITVSNDPGDCGAHVTYTPPAGATCDHASGAFFNVGTTTVTCTAGALSCNFEVTVTDDEAPSLGAITASATTLWPPNHQMVDVTVNYSATDNCSAPSCSIVSITSNEPENGLGDGDTSPDWQIVDAHHVRLRAERAGGGSGRVYTINVGCGSASGSVTVTVPKSQKK